MCCIFVLLPYVRFAQNTKMRELKVGYPLRGSFSYFSVAFRSGSFEKYGLKLEPIYIRGGGTGIPAALSGDLPLQLQGASAVVTAWARGAKEFQVHRRHRQPLGLHFSGTSFDQAACRSEGKANRN